MDPSIHSDVFARYERGVLEIVLMMPGDTVLNRMLSAAYSSASALLTAGIGDFDSTAKSAGAAPLG